MKDSQKHTATAPVTDADHQTLQDVELPVEDERYPGSFFKVPGIPQPGKTSWRIAS